jgi:hypothetical protein
MANVGTDFGYSTTGSIFSWRDVRGGVAVGDTVTFSTTLDAAAPTETYFGLGIYGFDGPCSATIDGKPFFSFDTTCDWPGAIGTL